MRLAFAAAALAVALAACSDDTPSATTSSTTSTTTTLVTTTTTTPTHACGMAGIDSYEVDIDGFSPTETVYLRPADGPGYELGLCAGDELLSALAVEGNGLALLGFVDLNDDGRREILIEGEAQQGSSVYSATMTIRGLAMTDLDIRVWIDDPSPETPFRGAGVECADFDDDGELDLLYVEYGPAETLVHIDIGTMHLEDTTVTEFGVDVFETDVADAFARWSEPDRCAPGSAPKVEVRYAPNGWGRLQFDPSDFASDGDVILTGVARGGSEDRYVVVGVEQASLLVSDGFFQPRPVVYSSADGLHWERADLGQATGELRDVVASDGRLVAVGRAGGGTGAVWVSSDGRSWELVEIEASRPDAVFGLIGPVISAVTATPVGIVAVGSEDYWPTTDDELGADIDAAVWLSRNGTSWERIEHPSLGTAGYQPNRGEEFNGELVDVTFHPGIGVMAVGSASEADPSIDYPTQWPTVWVSADGRDWQRHAVPVDGRMRGISAGDPGVIVYGVSDVMGNPSSDAVVLWSANGVDWVSASGGFSGLGEVDGIQAINDAVYIPGVGFAGLGSDELELEALGGAAVWWSAGDTQAGLASWEREAHDDGVFESLAGTPTATMTDGVWLDGELVAVGFSGRAVTTPGGLTGCCLVEPAIWYWGFN